MCIALKSPISRLGEKKEVWMTLKLIINISNDKKEVFPDLLSLPDFTKGMNGQEKKKEIQKKVELFTQILAQRQR